MRSYYELLRVLRSAAESDQLVNTITQGDISEIDIDKKNIYPLVHIVVGDATITAQTITFSVTIFVMDIRDENPEPRDDKFVGNDNEIDNLNTTLAIGNRIYKELLQQDPDGFAIGEATAEPFFEARENKLDGWALTFDVEIDNVEISLC